MFNDWFDFFQEILPFGYEYIIKEAVKNDETLTATIRANIFCEADAVQWLEQFEALSKLSFRVSRTYVPTENKLLYKVIALMYYKKFIDW